MPDAATPIYPANVLDEGREGVLGRPLDRIDGPLKVTGRAPYAYEYAGVGETAYGFILGASIAKGRIVRLDPAEAESAPGVLLVLSHHNAPPQAEAQNSPIGGPRPAFTSDQVRFRGQAVAFVVAETFEQARAAAALIQVDYQEEPARADYEAVRADALKPETLVAGRPTDTAKGDFDAAFSAAEVQLDVTYRTPVQHHNSLEPQTSMAVWEGDRLIIQTSTQSTNNCRDALAATLKIPAEKVRLVSAYVGGGFGAKLQIEVEATLAALAARELGRPVKVALTRQQTFTLATHRASTTQRVRMGADRDGRLSALSHDCMTHTGALRDFTEHSAVFTRSLYAAPNRQTSHRVVRLDLPVPGPMRAPGEASGMLALEAAMDELACTLGIDPIELRLRNEPEVEPESGRPFSSRRLPECMREGARLFGWERRPKIPGSVREGRKLIGYGMSAAIRHNLSAPAKARVRIDPDGRVTVQTSGTDIGTGSYTVFAQVAAEALGVPLNAVTVELGDTDLPQGMGSGGSIAASANGSAVLDACEKACVALAQAAGANDPAQLTMQGGSVTLGGRTESLGEFVRRVAPTGVEAEGANTPKPEGQQFAQHAYGAFFAEVEVDLDTAEPRLRRMLGVFAAGRILNPKTARSQLIGGMIWGVGSALHEETGLDPRFAAFVTNDLAGYHVPAHADIPEVEAVILADPDDKTNPLKSKGVGEVGICGAGAALNNAVFNATGVRVRDYPITLDKLLAELPSA
jgi:xanthine dehydrogenase YagR molybdenum-binding subunit